MSTYEVLLEKKGRGRAFSLARPWAIRTFKLKGQELEYYDNTKLKGTIPMAKGKAAVIPSKECDDKPFAFIFDSSEGERLCLNASCEDIRQKCIHVFNLAANDPYWSLAPPPRPLDVEEQNIVAAAVVDTMAADLEKQRLLAEEKRLEQERLQQVTAATAKMMEEELTKAKLREAQEAERKQQEEHQRQVSEMLKGMGAKARFLAARKAGRMDVAREAAAVMMQGAWRSRVARRRMLAKKAQKEALRRDAYARKIQCRYRIRVASRRVAAIKEEKRKIRERLAAIRFQSAWRVHKARQVYQRRLDEKMTNELNKSRSRQRRIITMQSTVRRFLASRRVARRRVAYPMVVNTILEKVEGVKGGDVESLGAIVSGLVLTFPIGHPALVNPNFKVPLDLVKSAGKLTSHYRVESVTQKKTVVATALNQVDFVVITLYDKSPATKDDFLGQAIVRVSEVLGSQTPNEFVAPLLSELMLPILDSEGKPFVHVRGRSTPHGTSSHNLAQPQITLGLQATSHAFSMCGWMWKVSESILSNAWKKRWFILSDGQLTYYNSDLSLEASKNVISCRDVVSLKEDSYKGRHSWKLTFTAGGVESFWMLDFDENESKFIREMWLRKLRRSCPALHEGAVGAPARSPSKSAPAPTKIPVSRRVSIFK